MTDPQQIFKELIIKGKTDGFLMLDDLNNVINNGAFEDTEVDYFINVLNEMGIPIYESDSEESNEYDESDDYAEANEYDELSSTTESYQQEQPKMAFDQKHTEKRWAFLNQKMGQEGLNEMEKREWQQLFRN